MSRLIIVSNRITLPEQKSEAGGLAIALQEALKKRGGIWFGWNGKCAEEETCDVYSHGNIDYVTMPLSEEDYQDYYVGFCNSAIWPLFHYRMELARFTEEMVEGYMRVNHLFAKHISQMVTKDDAIWVHDYQLMHVGAYLRTLGVKQRLGFFLHIPFPVPQVLMALPRHEELMKALCQYDIVGFQTPTDLHAFIEYVTEYLGGRVMRTDREGVAEVQVHGRIFKAGSFPISIDVREMTHMAISAEKSTVTQKFKHSVEGKSLIFGADRLDYTKGLIQRLEAFSYLLNHYPEHARHVSYTQIAPTSRGDVLDYQKTRARLESLAGYINGLYGDVDWVPVSYINKSFPRKTLAGFYRIARVGLVTPLRDGMNLVAKEYVASQDAEDPGVLILSQFAGAAHELTAALIVNPFDTEALGKTLHQALMMRKRERIERHQSMMECLRNNDIFEWGGKFLRYLHGEDEELKEHLFESAEAIAAALIQKKGEHHGITSFFRGM